MATREQRVAQFATDREPGPDLAVEVLCEDHVGTYVLPFLCTWGDGAWRNARTGEPIAGDVIGWRERGTGKVDR
jgi:hypothetical protein